MVLLLLLGNMNHLLKLGLKTESISIVGKYLHGLTFSNDLFQSVFNYSVDNRKAKVLEFIFDNFSKLNYDFLTQERSSVLNSICDINDNLSKYVPLFINVDIACLDEGESEFIFDWEAEDEAQVYQKDDTALKNILQAQDSLLSAVTIFSTELDLLNTIEITLPISVQSKSPWSRFIKKNKRILAKFYAQVTFDNQVVKDDISEILTLYFEELDVLELSQAINLSFVEMLSEHEIDFNNSSYSKLKLENYFIDDASSRFDEWLEHLDIFLEEWEKPKLSNPIYKYYFHMLGKPECQPLVKEEEIKLINSLQMLTYQVVRNELETILDEISENFNEIYENPYVLLSEEQQLEIQSVSDIKAFVSIKIKNMDVFLRPISISDHVRNNESNTSLKQLDEIKFLIDKFQLSNLRLVVNEAKKYQRNYIEYFFDLIQEGNISLLAAINRFDATKGHKFSTYATWWIKQSISRFIDINCSDVRTPIHYLAKLKQVNKIFREDYFIPSKDTPENSYLLNLSNKTEFSYSEALEMFSKALWKTDITIDNLLQYEMSEFNVVENKNLVSFFLKNTLLNEKEIEIITKRFGINRIDSMTLEEVGVDFGVTRERIRQIESNALKKLRTKVNATFNLSIDNSRTSTTDKAKENVRGDC